MDYAAAYTLQQQGFPDTTIAQAIALRNRVNDYYRGSISREVVSAELDHFQSEAWFQEAYLNPGKNLPEDVTRSKWWLEFDYYDPLLIWIDLQQPTLFLFAEEDRWVPIAESMSKLEQATAHIKDRTIMQIKGTDHLMYNTADKNADSISEEYIETMVDWLLKHM